MWRCIDPQVTHQKGDAAYPVSRMLSDGVRPRHIPVGELPEIELERARLSGDSSGRCAAQSARGRGNHLH